MPPKSLRQYVIWTTQNTSGQRSQKVKTIDHKTDPKKRTAKKATSGDAYNSAESVVRPVANRRQDQTGQNVDLMLDNPVATQTPRSKWIKAAAIALGLVLLLVACYLMLEKYNRSKQLHGLDSQPDANVPDYLAPQTEPDTGNTLTRISSNEVFGVENGKAIHQYSKRQAWNADGTLIDVGDKVLDATTYDILVDSNTVADRVWSNVDPDLIYGTRFVQETLNEFVSHNVRTGEIKVIRKFDAYENCRLGDGEGNISNNDQYVAINCRTGNTHDLLSYDLVNDKILGKRKAHKNFNWMGFSQSGEYILVQNIKQDQEEMSAFRYDKNFENQLLIAERVEHGDFGIDENGDDVYVTISWDVFSYYRLKDGSKVNLSVSDIDNQAGHGHVSCRNIDRPGWCYFSSYGQNTVGAIKLGMRRFTWPGEDSTGQIARQGISEFQLLGFHRSTSSNYASTPKASVNRSGTKVIFTSDWYGRGEINDYVLELSPEAQPQEPPQQQ